MNSGTLDNLIRGIGSFYMCGREDANLFINKAKRAFDPPHKAQCGQGIVFLNSFLDAVVLSRLIHPAVFPLEWSLLTDWLTDRKHP